MRHRVLRYLKILPLLAYLACSNAGDAPSAFSLLGQHKDISGVITGDTGSPSELEGWKLALVESDTRIARLASVEPSGSFTFRHVFTAKTFTLLLFSPTYVLQSVLSFTTSDASKVYQYFQITSDRLPRLIQKGSIISFQNDAGITFTNTTTTSTAGDGIPDGFANKLGLNSPNASLTDSTSSHLTSTEDAVLKNRVADLDSDGVIDIIDPEVLGDGALNVFNSSANGFVAANNVYFPQGLQWLLARYEITQPTSTSTAYAMTFFAQNRSTDPVPEQIQILGAPTLLSGATVEALNTNGQTETQTWDGLLKDDGLNYDGLSNDGLYARKVILANTTAPVANQVILFQLQFKDNADTWTEEYIYTFPKVTPATITTSYDATTRTITLAGDPFGSSIQNFQWSIALYLSVDGTLSKVYSSPSIVGTTRTYTVPENTFESGKSYMYKATARSLDRIPGYGAYLVESLSSAAE